MLAFKLMMRWAKYYIIYLNETDFKYLQRNNVRAAGNIAYLKSFRKHGIQTITKHAISLSVFPKADLMA